MDRVSVPSLGNKFSLPLPVIALVGHYPANKLIGRRLLPKQLSAKANNLYPDARSGTIRYYLGFLRVIPDFRADSYALLTRLPWV